MGWGKEDEKGKRRKEKRKRKEKRIALKKQTSVNGSLTGSDRHVGGVSDQSGTLHNRFLLVTEGDGKGRKFIQHLSHLVTTLTTTDVDNDIGVRVFRKGLGNDSLTTTESTV